MSFLPLIHVVYFPLLYINLVVTIKLTSSDSRGQVKKKKLKQRSP